MKNTPNSHLYFGYPESKPHSLSIDIWINAYSLVLWMFVGGQTIYPAFIGLDIHQNPDETLYSWAKEDSGDYHTLPELAHHTALTGKPSEVCGTKY